LLLILKIKRPEKQTSEHHLFGLDFMMDKNGEFYVLEMNVSPMAINRKNSSAVKAMKLKMYAEIGEILKNDGEKSSGFQELT
jgi:glutathione synthase/RimK-type ligase-like ATP-grasp enzyme